VPPFPLIVVTIPVTLLPSCKSVNVFPTPVNWFEISSKIKFVVGFFLVNVLPPKVELVVIPGLSAASTIGVFPNGGSRKKMTSFLIV